MTTQTTFATLPPVAPIALHLRGANEEWAHPETRLVRRTDVHTCFEYCTTQVWTWADGDAIVVVCGRGSPVHCWIVLRTGDRVQVLPCDGLQMAMECAGLDPRAFRIAA